jgi:hypothetical protein
MNYKRGNSLKRRRRQVTTVVGEISQAVRDAARSVDGAILDRPHLLRTDEWTSAQGQRHASRGFEYRPRNGRKLFEQFLRKVNKLQAQQQLEAQAQMGVTERSGEQGPV